MQSNPRLTHLLYACLELSHLASLHAAGIAGQHRAFPGIRVLALLRRLCSLSRDNDCGSGGGGGGGGETAHATRVGFRL